MKKLIPTEDQDCFVFADYLRLLRNQGKIRAFSHIPNETFTKSWNVKRKNKRLGVSRGVPDYVIVLKNKKVLWVEMKRSKGGSVSDEQYEWQEALQEAGQIAEICYGFGSAREVVEDNL